MGALATKPTKAYRVGSEGNTSKAVGHIQKQYGVDVSRIGHYSKHEVRALAIAVKEAKQQAEFAKLALANIEKLIEYQNECEKLRAEAIAKGLKGKETVDKYVLNTILATHGHEAHIQKVFQQMKHGMSLIDANSKSELSLNQTSFEGRIREIAANHRHVEHGIRQNTQAAIGELGTSQRRAAVAQQKRRGLMAFLKAEDYEPSGQGSRTGWFSGWFS